LIHSRQFWAGVLFGGVTWSIVAILIGGPASARPQTAAQPAEDNQELAMLDNEDQAD
jgi:hypothetical protein